MRTQLSASAPARYTLPASSSAAQHGGGARGDLGVQPAQQLAPAGLQPDRLAHPLQGGRQVARLRGGQAGPEEQLVVAGRQRAGAAVALPRLLVAALADEVVALGGQRVGVGQVEQAVELGQRLGVVVDAQVDRAPPGLALRGHHQQRADWRPRTSPPRASAACSAAIRRRASGPVAASNAWAIAGHTSGEAIMLAWALNPSPALVAGERDAALARVGGRAAVRVDDGDLPEARASSSATSSARARRAARAPAARLSSARGP